jgi:nucleoside-diphosphate-sugar epimerase
MPESRAAILVTGADGFLGRPLVERLRSLQYDVRAPSRVDGFDVLRDELDLADVRHVFHLVARTGVPDAWQDPVEFHLVNAHGVVRVLEQCRKAQCSLTYVSGYVYGAPQRLPIAETDLTRANNPYAFSKLMGEEACRFYASAFGVRANILRPFNIYGPGQDERFVLPVIVEQAIDLSAPEVVVKDLAPRRDYIYIDDVVSAALAIADQPGGAVFNVGSETSHSVAEIISAVFRATGVSKPIRTIQETRHNEVMDVVADCRRLRALGWRPEVSLENGVRMVVQAALDKRPATMGRAQ